MPIEKTLIDSLIEISSRAAHAAFNFSGKNDKIAADKAAVDSMRSNLNRLNINGKVVIGEGELDEAPMLFIGENLGTKNGPEIDIAVDPLEGTNFVANDLPGALAVIAIGEKDSLFSAPETYMNKIAADIKDKDVIDLDYPIKKNIENLSYYKKKRVDELTVCLLDRPRHNHIKKELENLGVNLKLISDGDVAGVLLVVEEKYNVDMFMGIGGGPEGVLAASALDSFGCFFQGKFIFDTPEAKNRAKLMGIKEFDKKYNLNEIIKGDTIFCATGITSGDLVSGIQNKDNSFLSETFVTHKSSSLRTIIKKTFML